MTRSITSLQLGAEGHAEFQMTEDSGNEALIAGRPGKDRVFAIGPEFARSSPRTS